MKIVFFVHYWALNHIGMVHRLMIFMLVNQVYTLLKRNINSSTKDKNHLKCDAIDGSVVNGLQQPILFSFILDKPPGCKVFREPEKIHHKKN